MGYSHLTLAFVAVAGGVVAVAGGVVAVAGGVVAVAGFVVLDVSPKPL